MSNTHVRTLSGLSEKATLTQLFTDVCSFGLGSAYWPTRSTTFSCDDG